MFLILCIVLVVAWVVGWAAFHVAGGLIHLLPSDRRGHFFGRPLRAA
jgi:Family of unknown function (DUF5670)